MDSKLTLASIYPWQKRQWQQLMQNHQQRRLAHALLFAGPQGLGKLHFAEVFAKSLLCEQAIESHFFCGVCSACRLTAANTHPDLLRIQPASQGGHITIEQIRQIVTVATENAYFNGYQVIIIAPAEAMNQAATNALLKVLEEPSAQTILILVSHYPKALPATIRSRCQPLNFSPPSHRVAQQWLAEKISVAAEQLNDMLIHADNLALQVITWQEQATWPIRVQILQDLYQLLTKQQTVLAVAKRWLDYDLMTISEAWLSWLAAIIRIKMGIVPDQPLRSSELLVMLVKIGQLVSLEHLFASLKSLYELRHQLFAKTNANQQLYVEALLFEWNGNS